ncbi:dihydrodipicolinate synthase family protein [Dyella tabacisoli]|uniref:Dihydrodipicolinate synthase family protein n=1 Tax=Dyella tabacisoli TaxID=2282381 RepID=A0A369UU94_9GAMM|nr:dihydrodipicolinate synthase family protein [Dyella tabacisoli]RDD81909.1 dihydrodipicolinate synthase family protein [Dyella tabacisoli]
MTQAVFKGIVAYPITPFRPEDGAVDTVALTALIDRLVQSGVHAMAPLGSTGENAYLSDIEWQTVAETSVRHIAKRVPVIVGISELTTQNAVRRAHFAQQIGADAVMVLPTSYWKLTEEEIFQHYAKIAAAIDLPIMVYNNPATSGVDMSPELMVRMNHDIDNVSMIKESSGDIQRMHRITQLSDGQIPFFNGSNPLALEAFAAGATGWCTAAPCLIPELTLQLYRAANAGDMQQARECFYKQLPLLQFILKGGLPKTIKAGLQLSGFDAGIPRSPVLPLDDAQREQLAQLLKALQT